MTARVAGLVLPYLLGSIPFGLLLVRLFRGTDLRAVGSGNIGATNALRSGSPVLGIATLLLDLGKGVAGALVARALVGPPDIGWPAAFASIAAPVLGHCFPVWLGFRGGKGVATGLGVLLVADPLLALIAGVVFALLAVPTRWVSLGSVGAALAVALGGALRASTPAQAAAFVLVAAVVIGRHHENIRRLLDGTEPRLGSR